MVNANEPISYRIVRIVTRRLRKDTSMVRIAARIVRIVTRVVRVVTRMVKIPTRMIRNFTTRKPSLNKIYLKYQPSGAGGILSSPAMPHRLQHRRDQLTLPKSKNGGHFSIVTWALRSTFAK